MPKLRNQVSATGQAGSANSIALSQSVALGAAALINGALLGAYPVPSNANITQGGPLGQHLEASSGHPVMTAAALLVPAQNVLITSAGNDSGVNFTIRGYDYGGSPISEVIAGSAGAPGTVTSALLYAVVLSVTASAATASTITIGTGAVIYSPWMILGAQRNNFTTNLRAVIMAGSSNFDVQATSDVNLMLNTGGFADDIVTLQAAAVASVTTPLVETWEGVRLKLNSGTGTVSLRALESRTA